MAVLGLLLLVVAAVIGGLIGLANAGTDNLVRDFSLLGSETTISAGRVFAYGAALGALGMLGLSMFVSGLRRGVKGRVNRRREIKAERNRASELESQLEAERTAHAGQDAIDLTEAGRTSSEETVGRHHRI